MGNYANLWVSKNSSPHEEQEAIDEIYAKWDVPLGWLALFEPTDFSFAHVTEDEDRYRVLYSSKDIEAAIRTLEERSIVCADAGGESWTKGKEHFVAFLKQGGASSVHVGYAGLMDDEFPASDQKEEYKKRVSNIAPPVFLTKRTMFGGRKVVLSDPWRLLVPAEYKSGHTLPAWHWFGGPPHGFDDWGALRPECALS